MGSNIAKRAPEFFGNESAGDIPRESDEIFLSIMAEPTSRRNVVNSRSNSISPPTFPI